MSRARRARGITLEDAERDTHVSKRYLQALETEEFTAFPAPVYARGFLRTYSRYLGLNPEELIRVFPNGNLTVDITPLPTVSRPVNPMSMNWVVAGFVMLFLVFAGVLLMRSGSGTASISEAPRQGTTPASSVAGVAVPASQPANGQQVQGKPIGPIRPGVLADFVGADMPSALAVLRDNQMAYVVIEVAASTTPKGLVVSQEPRAGTRAGEGIAVTLVVSKGNGKQ